MTFQLCACCESSLLKGKLLRLVIANLNAGSLGPNLFLIARSRSPGFCRLSVMVLVSNRDGITSNTTDRLFAFQCRCKDAV